MGNKERMDKFNKVSSVKTVGETSTKNVKNTQPVDFSDCDRAKDTIYSNNGKKFVPNGRTEKYFAEQGSTRNNESKANSQEISSNLANCDSSEWQPVQGKRRNEKETLINTYENKMFTRNTNKERFKSLERRTDQSISQKPNLNQNLDQKSAFRAHSNYVKSYRKENPMDSAFKNSISYSSIASKSVHQNYKKSAVNSTQEELHASTVKLNSTESKETQTEDVVLSNEVPAKQPLESDTTNCLLKNKGAITKNSRCVQTIEQADDTTFTTYIEQKIHKTKGSKLKHKRNEVLKSDLLIANENVSDKNRSETLRNETNECLKGQTSKDAKASLKNEEKVNDKIKDDSDECQHAACKSQSKCESVADKQELPYCSFNDGQYLLCQPVAVYPLHPVIQNSTFGEHFSENSGSGISCQHCYNDALLNESHHSESPNVVEEQDQEDQEQHTTESADNEGPESERNDCPNSNDSINPSTNLTYAYYMPFAPAWCDNGVVYYQLYPNYSPVQCSCFAPSGQ